MKEFVKYILFFIISVIIIYGGWKLTEWFIDKEIHKRTELIVPDTLVVERIKTIMKTDTVIKWYEIPFYKESKPEIIYIQSDSLIRKDLENKDLIISLKKENDELRIFAHNKADSLVKEYKFNDVGRDFSATATSQNIFVKSQKFYWNGINVSAEFGLPVNNLQSFKNLSMYEKNLDLSTGFNYKERLFLDFGVNFNINTKDYFLFSKLNYKILQ